jgi:peptidoglycan/LPS O-acetylase OafA/YrhL
MKRSIANTIQKPVSRREKHLHSLSANLKDVFHRPAGQYKSIDGLRALSVYFVIVFHCFYFTARLLTKEQIFDFVHQVPPFLNWVWHGDKGVDIFFVISGFLIGGMLFKEYQEKGCIRIKNFYFRRIFRILPVYVVALILFMFIEPQRAKYVWANLLFVNNFLPADWLLMAHSWSITVEVQFYLLYPLFFLFFLNPGNKKVLLLVMLFCAASLIRGLILYNEPNLYTVPFYKGFLGLSDQKRFGAAIYGNLYTRFGPLILGVLVSYLHLRKGEKVGSFVRKYNILTNLILIFALTLLIVSASVPYHDPTSYYSQLVTEEFNLLFLSLNRNIFSLCVAVVLLLTLHPSSWAEYIRRILSARILLPVAKVSYSIYLFHPPIILLAAIIVHGIDAKPTDITVITALITSVLTLLLAWMFSVVVYILIEKPAIQLNRSWEKARIK